MNTTVTLDGKTYEVESWEWVGDDIHVVCVTGEGFTLVRPWPASINFDGLDHSNSEASAIELTQRYYDQ